ncbi:Protein MAIN-LIKE 1 [Glycine soja]
MHVCQNLQILVRTRGLGRVLGKVISRALRREDHHHLDDVPQRRRPTTSALRQQEAAPVVEDALDVTEDVHAHAEKAVDDAEGFPGGPHDPSVLIDYGDHEHPQLKLFSHGRNVQKFGRPAPEIEGLVVATRLSLLIACSVDTGDRRLISAFVERWHKETNSFHLPIGELTITLDDVVSLLHLPIIGAFHSFETLHVEEAVLMLVELLEVSGEEVKVKTTQQCYQIVAMSKCEAGHWTVAACAYLLHLLGCTLFANKNAFRDLSQGGSYTRGAAALCWMYEHFPSVAESLSDLDYDEMSPHAYRWIAMKVSLKSLPASTYRKRLDGLTIANVCWMPYGDHCVVHDFDLISCFLDGVPLSSDIDQRGWCGNLDMFKPFHHRLMLSFEDIDDRWMHFSDYLAAVEQIYVVPRQCASDYMQWFFMISHPFMTPAQPADPDDTYVEPHIPKVPVAPAAAPAHAPSNVEQPRHAVEACQTIVERLDRLFNPRIVTADTKIHKIMKDCLRIARGVIAEDNVYVKSRRRRCTDQP